MRILLVHNALRSFVRVDRDILASAHEVDELDLSSLSRLRSLPARLAESDLVFAWFASLHSLAPVLGAAALRKPSVVVVGGYDTANLPHIEYGSMAHPVKRQVVRAICRSATLLVVNSHASADDVRRNVRPRPPVRVVYHGFEPPSAWRSGDRDPIVLSIGNVSRQSLRRKGHEIFARTAVLVPEARFILVGGCRDGAAELLRSFAGPNLELPGYLPQSELNALCARASVYVQASAHEGFGCSLAEAMSAGCVPVVSGRGALPEVVGEHGLRVDENDADSVADAVRRALRATPSQREAVADHVALNFPLARRRDALLALIAELRRDGTDG